MDSPLVSRASSGERLVLAPPPKVIVRPRRKLDTILVAWLAGDVEFQPHESGGGGIAIQAPVSAFAMDVDAGGTHSSFAIRFATFSVRSASTGAVHQIEIRLEAGGRLKWQLDGQSINPIRLQSQGPGLPPKPTLPPEFFGEYLGVVTEDAQGKLSPCIRIEW